MTVAAEHVGSVARARSFLFVPGNQPERFAKALQSQTDAIVLDLEDAVPPDQKVHARDAMRREWTWLSAQPKPVVVRINPPQSEAGTLDLRWLLHLPCLPAVMVAKTDSAAVLARVHSALSGLPVLPLIESAEGFARLGEIANVPNVLRLVVGHIDFMVDTGIQSSVDQRELDTLRFSVAMQTRLHQLAPAVDGITVGVDDAEQLRTDTLRALRFGFGAKLCIHPKQIAVVHAALAPSEAEVEWARRVIAGNEAASGAAFKLDGRMVDLPVVLQARRTLNRVSAT